MARAKHRHVRASQQGSRFSALVERLTIEAELRTKKLKKNRKFDHWYSVDPVGSKPGHLYPTLAVVYHRVRRER